MRRTWHHFCGIPDKNTYPVSTQTGKPKSSAKPKLRDSPFCNNLTCFKNVMDRGGPVVKNLPSNAEDISLIPGQDLGSYTPQVTKFRRHNYRSPRAAATESPCREPVLRSQKPECPARGAREPQAGKPVNRKQGKSLHAARKAQCRRKT